MSTNVYFLPWEKRGEYAEWLKSTGIYRTFNAHQFVGIKIHFGEEGNKGFIDPRYVKPAAEELSKMGANPFVTDANTIYVGTRADAVHHALTADKHGFNITNCGCPIIIADGLRGNSGEQVEVNLQHFKKVVISNAIHYSDSLILMSHFKGHELTGFGGAIKNAGMGSATRAGKYAMHDRLFPKSDVSKCTGCGTCVKWCGPGALSMKGKTVSFDQSKCTGCCECILSCRFGVFHMPWDENVNDAQEKIAEYAKGALGSKPLFCVNFVNFITKYCDCYPTREKPLMEDIGIFAGTDPVAVDQACADAINEKFGSDFVNHIFPGIDWKHGFEYAERIELGKRAYKLIK